MRTLDLNKEKTILLKVILHDEKKTAASLCIPPLGIIEEMRDFNFTDAKNAEDQVYSLLCLIMNINAEGIKFTAEDLKDKYKVEISDVWTILAAYKEAIFDLTNQKN